MLALSQQDTPVIFVRARNCSYETIFKTRTLDAFLDLRLSASHLDDYPCFQGFFLGYRTYKFMGCHWCGFLWIGSGVYREHIGFSSCRIAGFPGLKEMGRRPSNSSNGVVGSDHEPMVNGQLSILYVESECSREIHFVHGWPGTPASLFVSSWLGFRWAYSDYSGFLCAAIREIPQRGTGSLRASFIVDLVLLIF
jgi:hypothetical protein